MITEDYVSFETAKLLKEKGFDGSVSVHYNELGGTIMSSNPISKNCIKCPTIQMAIKWLREVHEIFIRPNTSFLYPIRYYCEIFCFGDNLKTQQDATTESFESPEEAYEKAIKYCLEEFNLI